MQQTPKLKVKTVGERRAQQVPCTFMAYLFQTEDVDLCLQPELRFDVLLFSVLLELFFKLLISRLPICNLDKTGAR